MKRAKGFFQKRRLRSGNIRVVYPSAGEAVLGPLQLILKIGESGDIVTATVCLDDTRYRGIVDPPFCFFLLPPPVSNPLRFETCLTTGDGAEIKETVSISLNLSGGKEDERPYELIKAKSEGIVPKRDQIYGSGPPNVLTHKETFDLITRYSGGSVLDVGCGIGAYTQALAEKGVKAKGLEIHPSYVDAAKERGLPVELFDGKCIPYSDCEFDTVIAVEVLEHVEWWEILLAEMIRVSNRRVLITTPNIGVLSEMSKFGVVPWHLLEATHVNFFTTEIWRHIILRQENVNGFAISYAKLLLNGESFNMHVFVLFEKSRF